MLIIQRHYLKEFFKLFALISGGLAFIFSILDLIDKIDDFMPGKPSLESLCLYAFFNFPKYLLYLMPAAILVCSLFIFSQASRNREITIIKATGGRLRALFRPFIFYGLLFTVVAFLIGEVVVPDFSIRSDELKNSIKKKGRRLTFQEGTLWLRATDGSPVRIELYVPERKLAKGVSIFVIEKDSMKERIEAEEAEWQETQSSNGIWRLKNATIYDIKAGDVRNVAEFDYPHLESPDFFSEGIKKPEEMGIGELYRYTERLKRAGFRNTKLLVDMNKKVSYPFINFFMILFGISLSMRSKIGGGLFAAGLGLLISALYWFAYTMMLSLGYAGLVPTIVSAWLVPVVFGIVSIHLFRKIPE
jgi:lipopolysaccharide export system permease protein